MESKIRILNAGYTNLTAQELLDCLMEDVGKRQKSSVIFLNVDVVMKLEKDKELADITERAEYVLADGMPLVWVSKLFHRPLKEKVSGSDFVPKLCSRAAKEGYSIFLAGGKEGVARQAAQRLEEAEPELKIAECTVRPFGFEKNPTELENSIMLWRNRELGYCDRMPGLSETGKIYCKKPGFLWCGGIGLCRCNH